VDTPCSYGMIGAPIMNKPLIFIPGLFALGIVSGIVIMTVSNNVDEGQWPSALTDMADAPGEDLSPAVASTSAVADTGDTEPVQALQDKVAELEARVLELEQMINSPPGVSADLQVNDQLNAEALAASTRFSQMNRMLTTESLVKAGISEDTAADIVRRRNELELRKLKLRDTATREGYIGTARYTRELADLMAEETTLREELGDEAYDRYLFVNKRPNRVKVSSVMLGSAAEQAGMKDGDIILTYGQLRVFEWGELNRNTSEGELGEYVNVDILRNGQLMSLWLPRGPLGVRLNAARVQPGR